MNKMINIGIDLGTTNSAIACWTGQDARIIKNQQGQETTPSVVRIDKKGRIFVGRQAYQYMFLDRDNVAARFKRYIHLADAKRFPDSGIELDAEQLSAEVLKSLLADACQGTGEPVRSAVITVPAAFTQLQCERTEGAAKLAGIEFSPLLQEPIAAAVAVGLKPDSRDRRWLVYDLGGGTFDVAVISTKDGHLSVLEHRGNNSLGGSDFDEKILRNLVLPNIQEHFKLPDEGTEAFLRLYQKLRLKVEELKIELSAKEVCTFSLDEYEQPRVEDYYGNPVAIEFDLNRAQVERTVEPFVQETVVMCREALKSARLNFGDIERLVLVGGPTRMPLVRAMLADLGLKLDYSVDPMTIVAAGAAVYASTIPFTTRVIAASAVPAHSLQRELACLNLSHEHVWPETTCFVAGKVTNFRDLSVQKIEARISNTSGHWNSGWLIVKNGYFEVKVHLLEHGLNDFVIELRSEVGQLIECEPGGFSIRHGLTIAEPPLPHSISIELQKFDGTGEFEVIFPRSTPLPAERTLKVQTAMTIKQTGEKEALAIKIWEELGGDDDREFVGALKINAASLRRSIPEGAEMLFKLNQSRILTVQAFVPLLDELFDRVFTAKESIIHMADMARNVAHRQIPTLYGKLENLQHLTSDEGTNRKIDDLWETVERLEEKVAPSNFEKRLMDPDFDRVVIEQAKGISSKIHDMEKTMASPSGESMEKIRADRELELVEAVVKDHGSELERTECELIRKELQRAFESKSERRIVKARVNLNDLKWDILWRQPWFWVSWYDDLKKDALSFMEPGEAKVLIERGAAAVERQDLDKLRESVRGLLRLLPQDEFEKDRDRGLRAGIKKMRL